MPIFPDNLVPKDPDKLVREVAATTKIKDIKRYHKLRDRVEFKWWESGVLILLFASAIGTAFNFMWFIPAKRHAGFYLSAFCVVLFVISIVISIEFLVAKLRAARQMIELLSALNDSMDKRLSALEKSKDDT
jgi:hypothetical protein